MLCAVINGPSYHSAQQQLHYAQCTGAQIAEIRIDLFDQCNIQDIHELIGKSKLPCILTLRSARQGGHFKGSIEEQYQLLLLLTALNPDYLDVEDDLYPEMIADLASKMHTKLVLSHHNYICTPDNLQAIWQRLQHYPAAYYKLATYAHTTSDTCRLLLSALHIPNAIAIAMGDLGQPSRILSGILQQPFTYACTLPEHKVAPGQLDIKTLQSIYHHQRLQPASSWYALLGQPGIQSVGYLAHNTVYHHLKCDAVYIQLQVQPQELSRLLPMLWKLGCRGYSVTMPYKETIIPLLDQTDSHAQAIGAVNTIVYTDDVTTGYNTDGVAAIDALETKMKVQGRHIVILGAGGAARAIAYVALCRGARVTVLNRTLSRAQELAQAYDCQFEPLENMQKIATQGYDAIINTIPAILPIAPEYLINHTVAMDIISKPPLTNFLQAAEQRGCRLIFGYSMFTRQALGQIALWLPNVNLAVAEAILNQATQQALGIDPAHSP
jgi:3-dehydroquinate dehydratase/shikimate dehydrogenase